MPLWIKHAKSNNRIVIFPVILKVRVVTNITSRRQKQTAKPKPKALFCQTKTLRKMKDSFIRVNYSLDLFRFAPPPPQCFLCSQL